MPHMSLRSGQELRAKPPRRRHWLRWVLGGVLTLIVLIVVAAVVVIKLQPSQPPLALPAGAGAAPAGQLDGTWQVAPGSLAGFRVRENFLGVGNDVTGRTGDVTGTAVVRSGQVTRATFQVSLAAITVNGKTRQPNHVCFAVKPGQTETSTPQGSFPQIIVSKFLITIAAAPLLAGELHGKVATKGLRDSSNAVVYVDMTGKPYPKPVLHARMNQKDMQFQPHVLPIVVGQTVDFELYAPGVEPLKEVPEGQKLPLDLAVADKVGLGVIGKLAMLVLGQRRRQVARIGGCDDRQDSFRNSNLHEASAPA